MIKIAVYQDDIKKFINLSFLERINICCDEEAKELIRDAIQANYAPSLPFQFNSPVIQNKSKLSLVSTEMIRDKIYLQLAFPYLTKKLSINNLYKIH